MTGGTDRRPVEGPTVLTVCPGGPLLIRGPVEIRDVDGSLVPHGPAAIAVCRCGRSSVPPFCDGTHKLVRNPVHE